MATRTWNNHATTTSLPNTSTVLVDNGTVTNKATLSTLYSGIARQGLMYNGKISVTVASNNLTLAVKTLAGNDPSASEPVYVYIGGAWRTITSALSVTAAAGTSWCNAGSAELATKEIDYFAYLGYNATDGVVVGFSRIPYATVYSDFNTTSTNEKYCRISTITNAAAGDEYVVIGRFAATLSAGAGYTWTAPSFTAANLIQRPIYETRKLTASSVVTYAGGTTNPTSNTQTISYYISGRLLFVSLISTLVRGTGDRPNTIFTAPFNVGATAISAVGMDSITAAGLSPATLVYIQNASITYSRTMANDGTYYASVWAYMP